MDVAPGLFNERAIPVALKPTARAIYHGFFRLQLRTRFGSPDRLLSMQPSEVPVRPAILRFRVSESLSVDEFLRIGEGCVNSIRQHVNDMGMDFASTHRVLDFGCGCGRTIRGFLRDGGAANLQALTLTRRPSIGATSTWLKAAFWPPRQLRRCHTPLSTSLSSTAFPYLRT
jgi:hypothetical protein